MKFSVDTHLFRELGDLLVGRDSTALVELVKNAYDADASEIILDGQNIGSTRHGKITIADNGIGMTPEIFESGFLRIASRVKEEGARKSKKFGRRYTGEKGIGRLSAHKLARHLEIQSTPDPSVHGDDAFDINATIDWDAIEKEQTLSDIESTNALNVETQKSIGRNPGTTIILTKLRRKWTDTERARVLQEVASFQPPPVLVEHPERHMSCKPLIDKLQLSDSDVSEDTFSVRLTGEFDVGEEYWQAVGESAAWIIEIDATLQTKVKYQISPTLRTLSEIPDAREHKLSVDRPGRKDGPKFQARIFVRSGGLRGPRSQRSWVGRMSGIRVYMEGFRVLPYGESNDDWLGLNADYTRRERTLRYLDNIGLESDSTDADEGLVRPSYNQFFGAVFLTHKNAGNLRMLVNREGFIPDPSFETVRDIVRIGTDLYVRVLAATNLPKRRERGEARNKSRTEHAKSVRAEVTQAVDRAQELIKEAKLASSEGNVESAAKLVEQATYSFSSSAKLADRLLSEVDLTRILAGIGLQMSAFVHELNGLLAISQSIERGIKSIREQANLDAATRKRLGLLSSQFGDLRQSIERNASYLTDVTSPDSRRRRSKQNIYERFSACIGLFKRRADSLHVTLENDADPELLTPPMFPAELSLVFTNLLQNALKAVQKNGRIRLSTKVFENKIHIRLENTGRKVDLNEAEKWFRPFESTTTRPDPALGQGMGMGLPLTRNMLEEYGAEISFVKPAQGFSTALEIVFP